MGKPTNLAKLAARLDSSGNIPQAALATGVAGNGPAFSASVSTNQTISAATITKVNFDTAPSWGAATNSWDAANKRFRPTVAGYYMVTAQVYCNLGWVDQALLILYINGSTEVRCQDAGSKTYNLSANSIVYLNGSTDYLELYVYSAAAASVGAVSSLTWIRGALIRSAT